MRETSGVKSPSSPEQDTRAQSAPERLSVFRVTLQVLGLILLAAAVLWTLHRVEGVLLLLVLAVFFAYLVAPLVALLRRPVSIGGRPRSLPLPAAIGAVYLMIFGALALAVWLLLPLVSAQVSELASAAPGYVAKAQAQIQSWQRYERAHLSASMQNTLNAAVDRSIKTAEAAIEAGILPFLASILGYLPWLVLVPILALFLLKDAELFRKTALRVFPRGRLRWRGDDFFEDVNQMLAAYVRAQLIACVIVGVVCAVGFSVIGVPYAVVLGIAAGVLEFIPLAGPVTIGAIAVFFASFHSAGQAVSTLVFLVVLRIAEDYVVYPRIIGHGIHLHPLAIIIAILSGAELAGLPGIFLSIPALAVLSVAFRHWREHRAEEVERAGKEEAAGR